MQDLKIAQIQSNLHWENIPANLSMFEEKIWEIDEAIDIIILPEMFSSGFTMSSKELAEHPNLHTFRWMKQMASQSKALIIGSYIVNDGGNYFNRLACVQPDGEAQFYDKRHLFRMADEDHHYTPGEGRLIVEWKGWKIMPLICYDLRFPVWSRNTINESETLEYDLLLYVANWPAVRVGAWDTLLKARAIENLCYSCGVNRVGIDGLGVEYNGHSAIYDFKGEPLIYTSEIEFIQIVSLSKDRLEAYREKFPAWMDMDKFNID